MMIVLIDQERGLSGPGFFKAYYNFNTLHNINYTTNLYKSDLILKTPVLYKKGVCFSTTGLRTCGALFEKPILPTGNNATHARTIRQR